VAFTIIPHLPESGTSRIRTSLRIRISGVSSKGHNKKQGDRRHRAIGIQEAEAWLVEASETTKLAPKAKQLVLGNLQLPKRRSNPQLVCVEAAHLPIEGTLVARSLEKVLPKVRERPKQGQAVNLVN
jgi:hypothetical protein